MCVSFGYKTRGNIAHRASDQLQQREYRIPVIQLEHTRATGRASTNSGIITVTNLQL